MVVNIIMYLMNAPVCKNQRQGDTFEVGIALLTAASSTGQQGHGMVHVKYTGQACMRRP